MKIVSIFIALLFVLPAFAVRRVGFGGGDAENTVLRMAQNLPAWSRACQQNPELCQASLLSVPVIEFEGEYDGPSFCEADKVVIPNNLLYLNEKTPRAQVELAQVLVQAVINCQHPETIWNKELRLLPLGKSLKGTSVTALTAEHTDVLVGKFGSENLHRTFKDQTSCRQYRVTGSQGEFTEVKCLDKDWHFLVEVYETPTRTDLHTRYLASED